MGNVFVTNTIKEYFVKQKCAKTIVVEMVCVEIIFNVPAILGLMEMIAQIYFVLINAIVLMESVQRKDVNAKKDILEMTVLLKSVLMTVQSMENVIFKLGIVIVKMGGPIQIALKVFVKIIAQIMESVLKENANAKKGFYGNYCQLEQCPNNCNFHGQCIKGECKCFKGYKGELCDVETCYKNCFNQGECINKEYCRCFEDYIGEFCEDKKCKTPCNNGKCVKGICKCDNGWRGDDCKEQYCPHDCHHNGLCKKGICSCYHGFSGKYCEISLCENNCNYKGICYKGKCHCINGFYGEDCSKTIKF